MKKKTQNAKLQATEGIEVAPGVIDLDPDPEVRLAYAERKLSEAIHQNLSNAAERVVHAAIDFVLNEGESDEDGAKCALEDAVYSFLDADTIHDALVELQPELAGAKIKKTKQIIARRIGPGVSEVPTHSTENSAAVKA